MIIERQGVQYLCKLVYLYFFPFFHPRIFFRIFYLFVLRHCLPPFCLFLPYVKKVYINIVQNTSLPKNFGEKCQPCYVPRYFNVWTEVCVRDVRNQTLAHPHTNFQFVEDMKVYSCWSALRVSWPTLSNRHWHKVLFLWAQMYIFIFRLVIVFVFVLQDI